MSKWYGKVGYGFPEEVRPGVYELKIVERKYYGDVTRNIKSSEQGEGLNDDIQLRNDISIIADAFAYENFAAIRYLTYMGAKWKVRDVEVSHPRLSLSIGGVYNGPTPETPSVAGGDSGA